MYTRRHPSIHPSIKSIQSPIPPPHKILRALLHSLSICSVITTRSYTTASAPTTHSHSTRNCHFTVSVRDPSLSMTYRVSDSGCRTMYALPYDAPRKRATSCTVYMSVKNGRLAKMLWNVNDIKYHIGLVLPLEASVKIAIARVGVCCLLACSGLWVAYCCDVVPYGCLDCPAQAPHRWSCRHGRHRIRVSKDITTPSLRTAVLTAHRQRFAVVTTRQPDALSLAPSSSHRAAGMCDEVAQDVDFVLLPLPCVSCTLR
ncbi:hypothetical protein BD309DRAFT_386778 [Dichomitus squalens]|nr:hypothetical protein BD309DRAFT_386778 [Dichomitus squalens]